MSHSERARRRTCCCSPLSPKTVSSMGQCVNVLTPPLPGRSLGTVRVKVTLKAILDRASGHVLRLRVPRCRSRLAYRSVAPYLRAPSGYKSSALTSRTKYASVFRASRAICGHYASAFCSGAGAALAGNGSSD
ncbi:hypothetical protein EVAR_61734_1 [Eumeta japonica]|uniref:Uncharacterized protein n=1 Tax=Eumeta variegata TaxID=151549 RepID=A0A4C1YIB3_EUMVA|nr:hypothetical protein EVAR_61734_1 [Eumeta japonica]